MSVPRKYRTHLMVQQSVFKENVWRIAYFRIGKSKHNLSKAAGLHCKGNGRHKVGQKASKEKAFKVYTWGSIT